MIRRNGKLQSSGESTEVYHKNSNDVQARPATENSMKAIYPFTAWLALFFDVACLKRVVNI